MKYLTIIYLFLLTFSGFSQVKGEKNIVGINHTIQSKILNEEKHIQVYLPTNYKNLNKKYPVVYLLDGQRFFLYGVSLYQSFSEFDLTPDFLVVGITNNQSTRMGTFSAGAKDFAKYLEKEVIPFIETTYRASKKRLLFGWAYGGGFGIETLMSTPNLFDGYILSSPYPVSSKLKRLDTFLNLNKDLNTFIYFTSDQKEFGVKEGTEELFSFLKNKKANLRWKFKVLSGEEHRSTVYPTLYHGIREYFEFYTEPSFADLKEFNDKGGMNYVKSYYKTRSETYNLKNEMSPFAKYSLVRLAINADNNDQFDMLLKEFEEKHLLSQLRESWASTIAKFYLTKKKKQKAIAYYKYILQLYPDSKRAKDGLNLAMKLNDNVSGYE